MTKRIAGVTDSEATGLRFLLQQLRRRGWYPLYASVSAYRSEAVYYIQLPDEARTLLTGDLSAVNSKIAALPPKGD